MPSYNNVTLFDWVDEVCHFSTNVPNLSKRGVCNPVHAIDFLDSESSTEYRIEYYQNSGGPMAFDGVVFEFPHVPRMGIGGKSAK